MKINKMVLLVMFVVILAMAPGVQGLWCCSQYPFRYEIQSNATGEYVINVNDNLTPNIWVKNASAVESIYLYCEISGCATGDRAMGNGTSEVNWENDTSGTGTNVNDLWNASNAQYVLHFNDTALAFDSVGTGDGTNEGCDLGTGVFGTGYDFERDEDDNVTITNPAIVRTNGWTMSLWLKHESYIEDYYIFDARDGVDETYIAINTGLAGINRISWWTPTVGGAACSETSPTRNLTDFNWHHLVFVWNTTDKLIYIDGIHNCTQIEGTFADTNSNYDIGIEHTGTPGFDGLIDEFRIYNDTKPPAWVAEQYYNSIDNLTATGPEEILNYFNLNVYNASDNATIINWHIYMLNGSADNYSNFSNTNLFTEGIDVGIPTGEVEMTIWRDGYGNATFNLTIDDTVNITMERHLINDTFFVNIWAPLNNSVQKSAVSFLLNITLPNYAEGNGSIWYRINDSGSYTLGCSNCTGYSTSIQLYSGNQWITALINASDHYLGEDKTHNITVYTTKYNISFLDEMTNKSINFSANKNGTLRVFCSDITIHDQPVTGTLHEFVSNCTGSLEYILFKLYDPKGDHYRTLIPPFDTGNLTFYMINTTPADVTVNLVTFLVTDASLKYQAGIMHFKKIILEQGQKDIIDTIIGSDGKVYANLIAGETYTISVESSDGTDSKTLGEYTAPDATTTNQPLTIIDITFIPTTYNYIGTDISWEMQFNTTTGRIYFYWNDSTEETTSIKFWIYNITNVTARTQMHFDSVYSQSHHLFQWDYVTNGNENDTYLGYFEVIHAIHGNITESRPLNKDTIFRPWLGDIGEGWYHMISIFLLVFVAAIFGARHAPIGAVILSIMAALFFYIEWLPPIIGGSTRLSSLLMIGLLSMSIFAMFIIKRRRI